MESENEREEDLITSETEAEATPELESGALGDSQEAADEMAAAEGEVQKPPIENGEAMIDEMSEAVDEEASAEGADESDVQEVNEVEEITVTQEEVADVSSADVSSADISSADTSSADSSSAETPSADEPGVDDEGSDDPIAQTSEDSSAIAEDEVDDEETAEDEAEDQLEPESEPLNEFRQRELMEPNPEAVASAVEGLVESVSEEETEPEPEPAAEEAEVPVDDRLWYVVHCYSGYENKVRHNLEQRIDSMGMKDRIFDVVVPTEEEIEVKDGKRKTVERRVFPGYILVQMILSEESWYVVRNTPGVTGFVGMGNDPTPLRPEEVASIIKRMEAEAPRIKVTYKIGQKVRINDGPFNDFIGTVDDIDMERAKVRVMVSFFGRETPVELDFLQVEKA